MTTQVTQIRVEGKTFDVPSTCIGGRTVVITGRWLKKAAIKDQDVVEGDLVPDPGVFIDALRRTRPRPDYFTFAQRLPDTTPRFDHPFEWDNVAAITLSTHEDWWKGIKDKTRNMVRKAGKGGVTVRAVEFSDDLVRAIMVIYNESPIRQGRRFWHYGKDFETVRRELATYLDRACFLGAYWEGRLIGFMKLVRVDQCATLFHFLSLHEHRNRSPMNALMSKAVEYCCAQGIRYLLYGRFTYGNKKSSPLADFKRHNGFEKQELPVYYIPLTLKGRIAVRFKFYRGLLGILPPRLVEWLVGLRARVLAWWNRERGPVPAAVSPPASNREAS